MSNSSIHQFKDSEQQALINWLNLPHDQDGVYFMNDFSRRLIRFENQEKTHYLMAYQGRLLLQKEKYYQKVDLEDPDQTFIYSHFTFKDDDKALSPPTDLSKDYYVLYELPIEISSKEELTHLTPKFISETTDGVESCIDFISDYVGLERDHPLAHSIFYKGTQNLLGPLAELCILSEPVYLNSQISFASYIVLSKDEIRLTMRSYSIFNGDHANHMYIANNKWYYMDPSVEKFEVTDLLSQMMALPHPNLKTLCDINKKTSESLTKRLGIIPDKLLDLELTLTGDQTLIGKTLKSWTHPQLAKEESGHSIHQKIHQHKFSSPSKANTSYWYQSPFGWIAAAAFFFFYPAATLSISSLLLFAFFYNEKQTKPNVYYMPLPSTDINPDQADTVDEADPEEVTVILNETYPLMRGVNEVNL